MQDKATSPSLSLPEETAAAIPGSVVAVRQQIRNLPSPAELPTPAKGSTLHSVEAKLFPYSQSREIFRHLTIALESLRACSQALGNSTQYASHARFAVSRAALENAGVCVWLLGDEERTMIVRTLRKALDEALQGARWFRSITMAGDSAQVKNTRDKWIEAYQVDAGQVLAHARELGLSEKQVSKRNRNGALQSDFSLTSIMRSLDQRALDSEGLGPDPVSIWSTASALAHGGQAVERVLGGFVYKNEKGQVLGFDKVVLLGQVSRAIDLYRELWSNWDRHARPTESS